MTKRLWMVSTTALLATLATAQWGTSTTVSAYGEGTWETGGRRYEVERMSVRFDGGSRLRITWDGDRSDAFNAEYISCGNNQYEIEVPTSPPLRGTLDLDSRGNLSRLDLRSSGNSRRQSLTFRAQRPINDGWGNNGGWGNDPWGNQNGWLQLNEQVRGRGTFTYNGRRNDLQDVRVTADRNGRITLAFQGGGYINLRGEYRERRGNSVSFELYEGLGRYDMSGRGTLEFENDQRTVRRISVSGTADRQQFRLDFSRGLGNIDETIYGRGEFILGRDDFPFSSARVVLSSNGRFSVRTEGRRYTEFTGTWREEGDQYALFVNSVSGRRLSSGRGWVQVDRYSGRVISINLTGVADEQRFEMNINW
jgi:hypothetical protein